MPTCKDVLEALVDLLDGEVDPAERQALETHLRSCRTCSVLLDSTGRARRVVADEFSWEVPEEVSERLLEKIRSRTRPPES